MTRYKSVRIKADCDDDYFKPLLINHLVVESNTDPQFCGVLDYDGNPIFRWPIPIGFGRDNEW